MIIRSMLPSHYATRYVVPLREGGSLPAVLETESAGLFVAKFRGAGQGARALIAEIIVGGLASAAGLPVPELALIELDESFGRSERDPEIQDILKGSRGTNVGMRYLEGAFNYDPVAVADVASELAADIVWLDAFATNIDRTARNPNMLLWENGLWLIDHGAALYFHHNWAGVSPATSAARFPAIRDHVLLPFAGDLRAADERMTARLAGPVLEEVIASIPVSLLMDAPEGVQPAFGSAEEYRSAYRAVLSARLNGERPFVDEAESARANAGAGHVRKEYRR
jgi:hypothetical protein